MYVYKILEHGVKFCVNKMKKIKSSFCHKAKSFCIYLKFYLFKKDYIWLH